MEISVSELSTFAVGWAAGPTESCWWLREQRTYLAHGCCPFLAEASFPAPVFIPGEREDFLLAAREKKYNIEVPIYKECHV